MDEITPEEALKGYEEGDAECDQNTVEEGNE